MEVRFAGSCGRPASAPSETGAQGGREVVVPTSTSGVSVTSAMSRVEGRPQSFPWHGPIVTVV